MLSALIQLTNYTVEIESTEFLCISDLRQINFELNTK
jgi:hypothetical protein